MYTSLIATLLMFLFQNGQEYYQQALVQERAAGNLEAAIQLYQDAARYAGNDRALAAQAMLAAARCYEKLGQAKARTLYEDIARSYADQPEEAAQARNRAQALQPRENRAVLETRNYITALEDAKIHANLWSVAPGVYWYTRQLQFDPNTRIRITGTVTQVHFVNPSISIVVEANGPNGNTATYTVKGGSPRTLLEIGLLERDTIRMGDVVTVEGLLGKEPNSNLIGAATLTLSDGRRIPLGQSVSGQ